MLQPSSVKPVEYIRKTNDRIHTPGKKIGSALLDVLGGIQQTALQPQHRMSGNDNDIGSNFVEIGFLPKRVLPTGKRYIDILQGRPEHLLRIICSRALQPNEGKFMNELDVPFGSQSLAERCHGRFDGF